MLANGGDGPEPAKLRSGSTKYEVLRCVGYHPAQNELRAVVQIKRNSGYLGGLCTNGSTEHVRFYLSFDQGASWLDEGLASVSTHELRGPRPLDCVLKVHPKSRHILCRRASSPLLRAILSWNYVPPAHTPDFVPVWGNVVQAPIRVDPLDFVVGRTALRAAPSPQPSPRGGRGLGIRAAA